MLKCLNEVNKDVLPLFADAAKQMLKDFKGDSEKALATTLAYISGNYKKALETRSLLTGQEKMLTLQMKSS